MWHSQLWILSHNVIVQWWVDLSLPHPANCSGRVAVSLSWCQDQWGSPLDPGLNISQSTSIIGCNTWNHTHTHRITPVTHLNLWHRLSQSGLSNIARDNIPMQKNYVECLAASFLWRALTTSSKCLRRAFKGAKKQPTPGGHCTWSYETSKPMKRPCHDPPATQVIEWPSHASRCAPQLCAIQLKAPHCIQEYSRVHKSPEECRRTYIYIEDYRRIFHLQVYSILISRYSTHLYMPRAGPAIGRFQPQTDWASHAGWFILDHQHCWYH